MMKNKLLPIAAAVTAILIPASAAAYTVQPGDTLSGIAANNNVSLAAVEAANTQLANYDLIYPGQAVTIPSGVAAPVTQAAVALPVATPAVQADSYLTYIFNRESGNNPYAVNRVSGACGLGQSLPCSKLLAVCGSMSNVSCQISFFSSYAVRAYGSTAGAYSFWQAHRWW